MIPVQALRLLWFVGINEELLQGIRGPRQEWVNMDGLKKTVQKKGGLTGSSLWKGSRREPKATAEAFQAGGPLRKREVIDSGER